MNKNDLQRERQVLAFAAMLQCIHETYRIADTGNSSAPILHTAIHSILALEAPDFDSVYQQTANLSTGLQQTISLLNTRNPFLEPRLIRHLISLLYLQNKLMRNKKMVTKLQQGIVTIQSQKVHFQLETKALTTKLAELYTQTISNLSPRIIINGEQMHLSNPDNIALIRTLLLAAIRAAVLWRQMGGSRWQLILQKKKWVETAEKLLGN